MKLVLIIGFLLIIIQRIDSQLAHNILSAEESVVKWIYCKEQSDCKNQPCHCPFPAISDPTDSNALNITAQIASQICINPLEDCKCYFGLCVCEWECGQTRSEMKSSATLEAS